MTSVYKDLTAFFVRMSELGWIPEEKKCRISVQYRVPFLRCWWIRNDLFRIWIQVRIPDPDFTHFYLGIFGNYKKRRNYRYQLFEIF